LRDQRRARLLREHLEAALDEGVGGADDDAEQHPPRVGTRRPGRNPARSGGPRPARAGDVRAEKGAYEVTMTQSPTDFAEAIASLSPHLAQVRSGRRVASGVLFEDGAHVVTIARLMGRRDRGRIALGDEELEV